MKAKKVTTFILSFVMIIFILQFDSITSKAAQAPGLANNTTYWIINANSGLVLDVDHAGTSNGTNVLQWWNNDDYNQRWRVTYYTSGDYYTIRPMNATSMYLAASSTSISNTTNVCLRSTLNDASKWTITRNNSSSSVNSTASNKNYVIKNKKYPNYVLTIENAGTSAGDNAFMYSYSSENRCNDEWIFVPANGDSLETVTIAVQQDKSYINQPNRDPNEIGTVMVDAAKPFYTKWHIQFRPSYYTISYVKSDDCPRGYYSICNNSCNTTCQNKNKTPNHHKNFDYNAYQAWNTYGKDGKNLRIVFSNADLCHINGSGGHDLGGLGIAHGQDMMVKQNRGHMLNVRVVQHELSHTFGAKDNECGLDAPCIMSGGFDNNYSYNLDNIWCSWCQYKFNRTAN